VQWQGEPQDGVSAVMVAYYLLPGNPPPMRSCTHPSCSLGLQEGLRSTAILPNREVGFQLRAQPPSQVMNLYDTLLVQKIGNLEGRILFEWFLILFFNNHIFPQSGVLEFHLVFEIGSPSRGHDLKGGTLLGRVPKGVESLYTGVYLGRLPMQR